MTQRSEEPVRELDPDLGIVVEAVTIGRVALLVLVTAMAVVFSGSGFDLDRQFPFGFLLFVIGGLALAYHRVQRSGADLKSLLATQLLVDVATTSYLVLFTGGAESQFVPLYLLPPLLGGVFLSIGGGVLLAALSSLAYVGFYVAGLTGLMPTAPYGLTQSLSGSALLLKLVLYVPLLFVVGVIGGYLGRRLREGRRALDLARAELDRALFDTESIIDNLASGLVSVGAQGIVRNWNRAAAEISGYTIASVQGREYHEAFGPGLTEFVARLEEALEQGNLGNRVEISITTPDGRTVPLGMSTTLLRDPDGKRHGAIGLFQDLSDVRALEERIRRRETLAAIGELSAGIAHEIRNCLNPISGSVEVLQRELQVEGENARLLDLIVRESERLDNFIRELLDYARDRPIRCETLDLQALLRDVVDVIRQHPNAQGRVLQFEGRREDVWVSVDAEQMKQVLMNLILNACEAMEEEGVVEVRIAAGRESRREGDYGSGAPSFVCVEVQDAGIGIPAAEMDLIFDPFYSTKRGGTGLGLAIASRIVERHGGTLEVDSNLGAGTTMRVWIPRVVSATRAVAHAA